ncbi:TetR/AcrR family transcriptional regulator [Bacillus sp. 165]|uniref:TetR/AcrR family transcriptional regulator n=1 Tax=Bacillus sp. 165 TaxID=1529117 RepID=UPI001ADCCDDF|nr:TetR/AcrR family transcriptional regulator [Bacillus sp. 165]MBO9131002.1 TetR/AcrR family transcriptional regulator [Bacillus sp. 165]
MDRRISKTRKLIKDALFTVSSQKGIDAVTVQDIIDEANINRATFYYHYKDKLDLIESILHEMLEGLGQEILMPNEVNSFSDIVYPPILAVFEHVKKHRDIYKIVLSEKGLPDFPAKMVKELKESLGDNITLLQNNKIEITVNKELLTNYISAALVSLIVEWVKNDLSNNPSDMANQITHVLTSGGYKEK